jgi:hypothetical protein
MKNRMWISSAAILALGMVLMLTVLHFSRGPKAAKIEVPVTITNETESLQVVSSAMEKNLLVLTIKNAGNQPIIAYRCDSKSKQGLTGDSTIIGELAPGSQFSILVPLAQLEQDANTGLYKLNIAMAFFEDGTAEGNWEHAANYRNKVIGEAAAAPQIREKMALVNEADPSAVKKLSEDLKALFTPPQKLSRWQQIGYEGAMIRAYGQAQIMLREQQFPEKIKKRMTELQNSIDRQSALHRRITKGGTQ